MTLLTLILVDISSNQAAQIVKKIAQNPDKIFWVYREKDDPPSFIPCGWEPPEAAQMIDFFDTGYQKECYEGKTCIAVAIRKWVNPWWCGVAWVTCDDRNGCWWGENNICPVYDLTGVKWLVFSLKGKTGKERVQIKICTLSNKPFGDRLQKVEVVNGKEEFRDFNKPIESEWYTLSNDWQTFAINLEDYVLSKVANGFTFIASRIQQLDEFSPVNFFIDNIYYSWNEEEPPRINPVVDSERNLVISWGEIKQKL